MRRSIRGSGPLPAFLMLAAMFAAVPMRGAPSCPPPSESKGSQCVLRADARIAATIWIPSGTHFNCQGHAITPEAAGTLDDPRTTANEFQPSQPELALFLPHAYGVKIQNCDISGFDFGIIVAQSKADDTPEGPGSARNKILGNTIDVRTNAIDVIQSDGVLIADNFVRFASERGRGIVLDYDSDGNEVRDNTIVSTDAASTGLVRQMPMGPDVTGIAVMDNAIHCLHSDRSLLNFVVSGVLFQVSSEGTAGNEDSTRSDHNLIEGNDVFDEGHGPTCTLDPATSCRGNADCTGKGTCLLKLNSGVGFNSRAADTLVRGNRIAGRMERGISFGGSAPVLVVPDRHPGTCTQEATRLCTRDADCNIPGYDLSDVGPCMGVLPGTINGNTLNLVAEGNEVSGNFGMAGFFANNTVGFVLRGNTIDGGASGIRLNASAIEGTVERNVVSGSADALYLGFAPIFSQTIRWNDFTDYAVAIRTSNDFTTPTDISSGDGNYWGLPCPGFDPALVLFENGGVNPNVVDGHPYGEPVAATPEQSLPPPCP